MSSRKAATAKAPVKAAARNGSAGKHVAKAVATKAAGKPPVAKSAAAQAAKSSRKPAPAPKAVADNGASAEATQLAKRIEHDLREGRIDTLSPQAFQALMAALCKSYGTQLEAGAAFLPVADRSSVSPTEIMTTTSALLKAANLAVFELGMWQSWTGR